MDYLNVHETAEKWGASERRVTLLCREGRIFGAKKTGKTWLIPANAKMPADGRQKEEKKVSAPEFDPMTAGGGRRAEEYFYKTYLKEPQSILFTPYRVCPVGAHVDHQFGKITGFAIDKGIYIAYVPKPNGVVELRSMQFPKRAQWHMSEVPSVKQGDWADHLRGATIALASRYTLHVGLCAVIDGELPIGGLSSSAAIIITFLSALADLNDIRLKPDEMITIAKEAENKYVGVACGKLDQSCEVYCRKNQLLYMDMLDDSYELIPEAPGMKPYKFAIFFSGLERSLASSKFNTRVDECRGAAYALSAFGGLDYGKYEEANIRSVPYELFLKYRDKLPEKWRMRAERVYSE
ncbi:MAG: hypothetical protein MJ141_06385, partial [Clostridia bacterium]|nr:hypothetical protein [Clostridia bacterium]